MRKPWIWCLAAFLLAPGPVLAADVDALKAAKERLAFRLAQDRAECAKGAGASGLLGRWMAFVSTICKARKNLEKRVDQTPAEKLPDVLADLFVDELSGGASRDRYPPMADYLEVFGEPAVAPLVTRYDAVGETRQKEVLRVLGSVGSEAALPLVRSELKKRNPWTLAAAGYALCRIRKEAAREELLPVLRDPSVDSRIVFAILQQLSTLDDPGWPGTVLYLAEEGAVSFETVTRLGGYEKYPEAVVAAHLEYLLARWDAGDSHTVACLLYRIRDKTVVKQWLPILEDLLRAKYAYTPRRYSPLIVRCRPFRRHGSHPLLDRIEETLTRTDVEEWMTPPAPGWLSYFYLRELRQAKGGASFDAETVSVQLAVSVYDDAGDVLLGQVVERFDSGVTRTVELPLKRGNAPPYRISLTPRMRRDITANDRWSIYIPDFHVKKPVGVGFPLTVALGSSDYQKTSDSGYIMRWEVRHVGRPPAAPPLRQ